MTAQILWTRIALLLLTLSSYPIAATLEITVIDASKGHHEGDSNIVGVKVVLYLNQAIKDSGLTDDKGRVVFENRTRGIYQIIASRAEYQSGKSYAFVNNNLSRERVTIPLMLLPTLPRMGSLAGLAQNGLTKLPLREARVILSHWALGSSFRDTVFSDSLGRFKFDSLSPGNGYSLHVDASEFESTQRSNFFINSNDTTRLDIALAPIHVKAATIKGRVLDPAAKPLLGATVILRSRSGETLPWLPVDTVYTDSEGRFAFRQVGLVSGAVDYSIGFFMENFEAKVQSIKLGLKNNELEAVIMKRLFASQLIALKGSIKARGQKPNQMLRYSSNIIWVDSDTKPTQRINVLGKKHLNRKKTFP